MVSVCKSDGCVAHALLPRLWTVWKHIGTVPGSGSGSGCRPARLRQNVCPCLAGGAAVTRGPPFCHMPFLRPMHSLLWTEWLCATLIMPFLRHMHSLLWTEWLCATLIMPFLRPMHSLLWTEWLCAIRPLWQSASLRPVMKCAPAQPASTARRCRQSAMQTRGSTTAGHHGCGTSLACMARGVMLACLHGMAAARYSLAWHGMARGVMLACLHGMAAARCLLACMARAGNCSQLQTAADGSCSTASPGAACPASGAYLTRLLAHSQELQHTKAPAAAQGTRSAARPQARAQEAKDLANPAAVDVWHSSQPDGKQAGRQADSRKEGRQSDRHTYPALLVLGGVGARVSGRVTLDALQGDVARLVCQRHGPHLQVHVRVCARGCIHNNRLPAAKPLGL